jgi:hypothetical protein
MNHPSSVIQIILAYLLVAPGVGTITFFAVLGAPSALWLGGVVLPLVLAFGYGLGALPALGAGLVAAVLCKRVPWQRVLIAACVAIGLSAFVELVLHPGPGSASPEVKTAIQLGGFVGALASGLLIEWRRRAEKIRASESGQT